MSIPKSKQFSEQKLSYLLYNIKSIPKGGGGGETGTPRKIGRGFCGPNPGKNKINKSAPQIISNVGLHINASVTV